MIAASCKSSPGAERWKSFLRLPLGCSCSLSRESSTCKEVFISKSIPSKSVDIREELRVMTFELPTSAQLSGAWKDSKSHVSSVFPRRMLQCVGQFLASPLIEKKKQNTGDSLNCDRGDVRHVHGSVVSDCGKSRLLGCAALFCSVCCESWLSAASQHEIWILISSFLGSER